jgi:hypothetical protein
VRYLDLFGCEIAGATIFLFVSLKLFVYLNVEFYSMNFSDKYMDKHFELLHTLQHLKLLSFFGTEIDGSFLTLEFHGHFTTTSKSLASHPNASLWTNCWKHS